MSADAEFGPAVSGGRPRTTRNKPRSPNAPRRGGPSKKPRARAPKRRSQRRPVRAVVLLVAALLVLVPLALLLTANARMEKVAVPSLAASGSPYNVLLTGSDSRAGMTREEQLELSTGSEGGDLTDTIMLASIQGGQAALLAFPRDLYVTRCDGSQGRINAAVRVGGPDCLVQTVSELSGLPIHQYMEIRFLGFRDVVDALGGVELCLDEPIRDANAGLDLPAGCQTLDGANSLGYVRVRNIDDDFGRMERQQEFLKAVASEATQPATLVNVPRLFSVAAQGGGALRASEDLGPFSMLRVGWGLRGLAGGAPAYTVPGSPALIGGAAVLEPLQSEAQPLFERFRTGAIFDEAAQAD